MKWNERSGNVLEWAMVLACLIIVIVALLFLSKAHAGACLIIDVPPQAVLDNYDGDTFVLFTLGPGGKQDFRLDGIDTPERNKKEPGWEAAKLYTKTWLANGPFRLTTCGKKTLTRIVAQLERDGRTLAQDLEEAGHATKGGR